MAERGHQKLEVEVEGTGFEETAKKSARLDDVQGKLTKQIERAGEVFDKTGEAVDKAGEAVGKAGKVVEKVEEVFDKAGQTVDKFSEGVDKLGDAVRSTRRFMGDLVDFASEVAGVVRDVTAGVAGMVLTVRGLSKAMRATKVAWRVLPSAMMIVRSGRRIISILKQEIAMRLRLVEVMKIQGKAQDELLRTQLSQQQRLQDVAGRRRIGGFESVEAAHWAQAMATRAKEQFTRLSPEAIDVAFGTFGDIEGLTQRQLTDMAILAQEDKLQDLDTDWSRNVLKRYLENKQRRQRETIEKFARVETRLGAGMGRGEYRTGQPTVRAQRAAMEIQAGAGAG